MKKALLDGARICEVVDTPFPVADALQWVDVPDSVTTEYTVVDGAFTPPAAPPLTPPDPLAAGLAVVFASAPALSGTYAVDADAQRKISGIAAGIGARNRLPGGLATFDYTDGFGTHTFTAAQFLDLASAVEDHLYALSRGTVPAQPVTVG